MTTEVDNLRRQLAHVTDLHERAEARISELIGAPDRTEAMRQQLYNPEVGVPLLMYYDKALNEKDQTVAQLQSEISILRGALDARNVAGREAGVAAKTAEQRAHLHVEESEAKVGASDALVAQLRKNVVELQAELSAARDRISSTMISEGHLKDEIKRLQIAVEENMSQMRAAQDARAESQGEADALRRKLIQIQQSDEEGKASVEGHKIQLHLAARENDDKVQELERLRGKMSQALKQASENHVQHLKLVEEKHRAAVESQREELRGQEAVITKLRAQLARADWLHGANKTQESAMTLVDSQTRIAQEQEIKRLYAEVSALTAQRDEAVFRLEAASSSRRNDLDERLRESKRDCDSFRMRVRELEERLSVLQVENSRALDEARIAREECRVALAEKSKLVNEKHELMRSADSAKRSQVEAEERLEANKSETKQQMEAERRVVRTMERRISDMRQEDQQLRERLSAECDDLRRQTESSTSGMRELSAKNAELRAQLGEKDKILETLSVKCERLGQGLQAHKAKLVQCDQRIGTSSQREQNMLEELHNSQLLLEQTRLEAAKSIRDRDRMQRELVTLSMQLEMLSKRSNDRNNNTGVLKIISNVQPAAASSSRSKHHHHNHHRRHHHHHSSKDKRDDQQQQQEEDNNNTGYENEGEEQQQNVVAVAAATTRSEEQNVPATLSASS